MTREVYVGSYPMVVDADPSNPGAVIPATGAAAAAASATAAAASATAAAASATAAATPATTITVGGVLEAADVANLTDSTGGSVTTTLADVTVTPTQALINHNFASLNAHVNSIVAALKAAGIMA